MGKLSAPDSVKETKSGNVKGAAKASKFAMMQKLKDALESGMDKEVASFQFEPGRRYHFQLSMPEECACLYFLCALNTKEQGEGLVRCEWSERSRLKEQGYDFIPPPEWAVDGPEKKGFFTGTYMSEHDDYVNVKARRNLAERF